MILDRPENSKIENRHGRDHGGMLAGLLRGAIIFYRTALSPWLGPHCRFAPSCSAYAQEALRIHGVRRGAALALRRICRCHPWGGMGYDPVPPVKARAKKPEMHS